MRTALASDLRGTAAVANAIFVGRLLAVICHPVLGWRRLNPSGRVVLAAGYAGLSYLTVLIALLAFRG